MLSVCLLFIEVGRYMVEWMWKLIISNASFWSSVCIDGLSRIHGDERVASGFGLATVTSISLWVSVVHGGSQSYVLLLGC